MANLGKAGRRRASPRALSLAYRLLLRSFLWSLVGWLLWFLRRSLFCTLVLILPTAAFAQSLPLPQISFSENMPGVPPGVGLPTENLPPINQHSVSTPPAHWPPLNMPSGYNIPPGKSPPGNLPAGNLPPGVIFHSTQCDFQYSPLTPREPRHAPAAGPPAAPLSGPYTPAYPVDAYPNRNTRPANPQPPAWQPLVNKIPGFPAQLPHSPVQPPAYQPSIPMPMPSAPALPPQTMRPIQPTFKNAVRQVTHIQPLTGSELPKISPIPVVADEGAIEQAGCVGCGGGSASGSGGYTSELEDDLTGCSYCAKIPRLPCFPGEQPYCNCGMPLPDDAPYYERFFHCLYQCLCCPDPCYEGKWIPLADTAFYAASARPRTQQRLRWNAGQNMQLPDRSEFFWARADGSGKGPPVPPNGGFVVSRFHYNELSHYTEAAVGKLGVIIEMPYRSMDLPDGAPHYAGFGDFKVGTKTMFFDCELLQFSFQFLTYTPVGNSRKGLGVGHVSLEPSILLGVKLGPDTYYQGQFSEWIPLGGDPLYAGAVLHTHSSLNHVLFRFRPEVQLIGCAELNSWSFQDGAFTDPVLGSYQSASGATYLALGAGARLFVCDRIDFGLSMSVGLNQPSFYSTLYTSEFRWRF